MMSCCAKLWPGEILNALKSHINLVDNWTVFPQPKAHDPKFIHLLPDFEGAIMASGKLVEIQKISGKIKEFKKETK